MTSKGLSTLIALGVFAVSQAIHAQDAPRPAAVKQLVENGFKKCADKLSGSMNWVNKEANTAHITTWSEANPDKRTATAVTSKRFSDGDSMLGSFTASPDVSGNCTTTSMQVFISIKSCPKIREDTFKDWKFLLDMSATTAYELNEDKRMTVYLTPISTGGCVVMKQVVFY